MRDLLIGLFLLTCPAAIFVVFGASGLDAFNDGASARPRPRAVEEGRISYLNVCGDCHGRTAGGTRRGPALILPAYAPARFSDEMILVTVRRGVPAAHGRSGMPAITGLSDRQADTIVAFLRQLQQLKGVK